MPHGFSRLLFSSLVSLNRAKLSDLNFVSVLNVVCFLARFELGAVNTESFSEFSRNFGGSQASVSDLSVQLLRELRRNSSLGSHLPFSLKFSSFSESFLYFGVAGNALRLYVSGAHSLVDLGVESVLIRVLALFVLISSDGSSVSVLLLLNLLVKIDILVSAGLLLEGIIVGHWLESAVLQGVFLDRVELTLSPFIVVRRWSQEDFNKSDFFVSIKLLSAQLGEV